MNIQTSDSLKVATVLTFIGGFLETYSFLLKGNVFATAITGNIVLMFYNIANLHLHEIIKYILPIIGFGLGIVASDTIKKRAKNTHMHWREYILIFEMILVVLLVILRASEHQLLTISMISFMSGIQIETFKKINKTFYMSTMCTGNTRKLVESILHKDYVHTKIFSIVILFFGLGAITASILIKYFAEFSILCLFIPLGFSYYWVHHNR